jgi:hypothetical protein
MNIECSISIIALLVAILSAIYARRAVSEAKNANRISSHQHKLVILEVARDFKHIFRTQGEAIEATLVYALLAAAGKTSLYFTRQVADHYSQYAEAAYHVLIARDRARSIESAGLDARNKWEEVFALVDSCRNLEGDLLVQLELQTKIID